MNTILLQPTDVLFFRDGRPMSGSLSGHGAAWPLPNVISHAFHAALHRAELEGVHAHRRGRSGHYEEARDRKFGSLTTAGPFPVSPDRKWFFPRPADAGASGNTKVTLRPIEPRGASSLPDLLRYPVGNTAPPSKAKVAAWWSAEAWRAYRDGSEFTDAAHFRSDSDFADTEHTYGIAIDGNTGTVEESKFYSASYLRLREDWRLGALAQAPDKEFRDAAGSNDLVSTLLNGQGGQILVGGQQRVCTAVRAAASNGRLPLPAGLNTGFAEHNGKFLVKWILLTPAIFPAIKPGKTKADGEIDPPPGGWLPNWIAATDQVFEGERVQAGSVLLLDGPGKEKAKRKKLHAGTRIQATLVAAIVGKPLPVTGWALPNGTDREQGGAKSTHLAVPAGAVYYFECDNSEAAEKLAGALNWHGSEITHPQSKIANRRSTLLGEKGFGLGVCGAWRFIFGTTTR